ncbi:hypothetical protein ABZ869_01400 [Streptomyces sp. NPDC046928]|uniref:hypothetical protein n=1 Tax=Streptomyces sp. NPDC046928 TaxID=3155021 RepID=UPI0033F53CF9
MLLTIEVKRHAQGEAYFDPWIEDLEDGCRFHFHWDDISDEGTEVLREVFTEQAKRWRPRAVDAPPGRRISITMERRAVMSYGVAVAVDDRADYIHYTARADLISERGARSITRHQSERSPYWERTPAQYQVQLRAV